MISACLQKFAVCQRRPEIVTRSASVSIVLLPILLYLAARHGTAVGFALAIAFDKCVLLVAMLVSIMWDSHLRGNFYVHSHYSLDVFESESEAVDEETVKAAKIMPFSSYVREYLRIGSPSAVAFCIDTWTFEFLTLMSARCGPTEAAAWVLMQQLTHPIFATANGLASAAATDVGNAFGAGCRPHVVFSKVRIAAGTAVVVGLCSGALLYNLGPKVFPLMISKSHEGGEKIRVHKHQQQFSADDAIAIGTYNMPVFALQVCFDIPFYTLQGVYRGLGQQNLSAKIVFVAMWCIAIPISIFFPVGWGGCVRGIVTALFFGSSSGALLLYRYVAAHLELLRKREVEASTSEDVTTSTKEMKTE